MGVEPVDGVADGVALDDDVMTAVALGLMPADGDGVVLARGTIMVIAVVENHSLVCQIMSPLSNSASVILSNRPETPFCAVLGLTTMICGCSWLPTEHRSDAFVSPLAVEKTLTAPSTAAEADPNPVLEATQLWYSITLVAGTNAAAWSVTYAAISMRSTL